MKFLSASQTKGLENILKQIEVPVMKLAFERAINYLKQQGYSVMSLEAEYLRKIHELNLNRRK